MPNQGDTVTVKTRSGNITGKITMTYTDKNGTDKIMLMVNEGTPQARIITRHAKNIIQPEALNNYLVKMYAGSEYQVSAHTPDEALTIAQNLAPSTGTGIVYKYVDGKTVLA